MSSSWVQASLQIPIADTLADFIEPVAIAADIVGGILTVAGAIITVVAPILVIISGSIPLPSTDEILAALLAYLEDLISIEVAIIHHYPCRRSALRSFGSWKEDIYLTISREQGNECIDLTGCGALLFVVSSPADFEEMQGSIALIHRLFGTDCIPDEDDDDLIRLPSLDFLRRFHCLPFGDVIPAVGDLMTALWQGADFVSTGSSDVMEMMRLGELLIQEGQMLMELADFLGELVDFLRLLAAGISVSMLALPACTGADNFRDQLMAATGGPSDSDYAGGTVLLADSVAFSFLSLLLGAA